VVLGRSTLPARFLLLFSALYLAFGAASPFLPAFLASRGLMPEQTGLLLFLATAIRLVSGPIAGHFAGRLQALRTVLTLPGTIAICFIPATGIGRLVTIAVLHAATLAPTTFLTDALDWPSGRQIITRAAASNTVGYAVRAPLSGLMPRAGPDRRRRASSQAWHAFILAAAAAMSVPELVRPHDGGCTVRCNDQLERCRPTRWCRQDPLVIEPLVLRYLQLELAMTIAAVAAVLRRGGMDRPHVSLCSRWSNHCNTLLHISCMRVSLLRRKFFLELP
jgi:MFS_1 like family